MYASTLRISGYHVGAPVPQILPEMMNLCALYLSIGEEHVAVLHGGKSLAEDESDHLLPDDRARHARQLRVDVVFQNLHKLAGIFNIFSKGRSAKGTVAQD